jgi:hypothetical protein
MGVCAGKETSANDSAHKPANVSTIRIKGHYKSIMSAVRHLLIELLIELF